jgi:hypothetical protein
MAALGSHQTDIQMAVAKHSNSTKHSILQIEAILYLLILEVLQQPLFMRVFTTISLLIIDNN